MHGRMHVRMYVVVCAHVSVCMHGCIRVCRYVRVRLSVYECLHSRVNVCAPGRVRAWRSVGMNERMCVAFHSCMRARMLTRTDARAHAVDIRQHGHWPEASGQL